MKSVSSRRSLSPSLSSIAKKPFSDITNADVLILIDSYKKWLMSSPEHITWSSFCNSAGIKDPYRLNDYLTRNFTGAENTVDFQSLYGEVQRMLEDKLIEAGIFNPKVNANFLKAMMDTKFNWHSNVVVAGISVDDIMDAKRTADRLVLKEKSNVER